MVSLQITSVDDGLTSMVCSKGGWFPSLPLVHAMVTEDDVDKSSIIWRSSGLLGAPAK